MLYGVEVRSINQAVSRNPECFPDDFMVRITAEEAASLRSQTVILEPGRGRHRKFPQAEAVDRVRAVAWFPVREVLPCARLHCRSGRKVIPWND